MFLFVEIINENLNIELRDYGKNKEKELKYYMEGGPRE